MTADRNRSTLQARLETMSEAVLLHHVIANFFENNPKLSPDKFIIQKLPTNGGTLSNWKSGKGVPSIAQWERLYQITGDNVIPLWLQAKSRHISRIEVIPVR